MKIRFAGKLVGTESKREIFNYNDEPIIKIKYTGYDFTGYYGYLDNIRDNVYNNQHEVTEENIEY
jgi:hypothetical protein